MTDEEIQAKVDAAVEAATKGLKTKNDELLASLKKEKDEKKAALEASEAAQVEAEAKAAEAAEKSGDVEKVKKTLEDKYAKELKAKDDKIDGLSGQLNQHLIDGGLTAALVSKGIAPQHIDTVLDHIKARNKAEIIDSDGKAVAHIGGKPLEEFVDAFSQGDKGKHYFAAPANGGGGSNGQNGGSKATGGNGDMGGDKSSRTKAIAEKYKLPQNQ